MCRTLPVFREQRQNNAAPALREGVKGGGGIPS